MHFPAALTDEEELLKLKYAKLRKKKKALQALRNAKPEREPPKPDPVKRPLESAEDRKEQAKKLLKSGAIKIGSDGGDKQSFKRSKTLEKKLKDPEKTPMAVGFQPFAAAHPEDEDRERDRERGGRSRVKGLYDSFVSGGTNQDSRPERERDSPRVRIERSDMEPPKKGHTIYVHGHGISEDICRKAFSNFGTIININMETDRNCGFVTFEKTESSDQAIAEVHGGMIDGVQLKVSMARRQPAFEQVQDASSTSWASIAASHSQKGSHKDKRNVVTYDTEDIF